MTVLAHEGRDYWRDDDGTRGPMLAWYEGDKRLDPSQWQLLDRLVAIAWDSRS